MWLILPVLLAAIPPLVYYFPIRYVAKYDELGARAWLWLGFIKLQVYPEKLGKKEKSPDKHFEKIKGEESDDTISAFFSLIKSLLDLLMELRERLSVKKLEFKLILAGSDPADLAVNYGRAWAALGNLMPHLERLLRIKKRDLEVECDFTAPKTTLYAYADLRIPLGKAIYVLYKYTKIKEKVVQSYE